MPKTPSKKRSRKSSKTPSIEPTDGLKNKILSAIFLSGEESGLGLEEIAGMIHADIEEDGVVETLALVIKEMEMEGLLAQQSAEEEPTFALDDKGFERIEKFPD